MSIFDTFVAKRKTIEEFCAQRDTVMRLLNDAHGAAQLANNAMKSVYQYGLGHDYGNDSDHKKRLTETDRRFWSITFEHTGFMQLLDAQARKKFDEDLHNNPPEFTMGNIQSTFLALIQDADMMFQRGVVNVFKRLSPESYRTNDVFKIGERAIMTYMVEPKWKRGLQVRYGMAEDQLNDIDRVFKVLDNKQHNPRELTNAMNAAFENSMPFDNDYYQIKAYRNGNIHVKFKRPDLLEKVNLLIAKEYGGNAVSKGGVR